MFTQPLPVARACVLSPAEIERPNADPSGSEASLLQLIQDHHQTSLKLRDETEKAKKDAIRTTMRVSDLLVDTVNGGVQEAFINEKRIELESRALTATVIRFAKQTHQWLAASHAINTAIKDRSMVRFSFELLTLVWKSSLAMTPL
ncbi:biogenesis of lysosome-related organelles complex 1 subunit 1-like [Vitis riparia]|uniref:biogenesis of lysosome-related organelles complex 1 subunit 1-like n=1 Tax=Vitis riparia TaxID=96939 RepID=UPI00155B10A8|nr:biogenesis of lysosome-related organelles complex 1 subunit 1-like [Vitis riparia]